MQKDEKLAQIEKLHKAIYTECEIDLYDRISYGRGVSKKAKDIAFLLYRRAVLVHFKEMGYNSEETKDDNRPATEIYDEIIDYLKEVFKTTLGLQTSRERDIKLDKIIKECSLTL